jgi:DNA-directed RNA polymerase subunit beta
MPKTDSTTIIRQNWGRDYETLPKLDLLNLQRTSYQWFLEKGIGEILQEISPIDDFTEKNWTLTLKDYRIGKPSNTPEEAMEKGITHDAPLYVEAALLNKKTEKVITQEIFLG